MTTPNRPVPRATYRLQLHKGFNLAQAATLAPYLAGLGISHAYLSPILKARPGSTHGYDIVDHTTINPELGTIEDFRRLATALERVGIGIVLDIVPNHMGIGGAENPWWLDVLEWGQASRFARWFEIDWDSTAPGLAGRVLVPFLDRAYADALRQGVLELRFDATEGSFAVWASGHHKLPVTPSSYEVILDGMDWAAPTSVATLEDAAVLKHALRELYQQRPGFARSLDARLASLNADPAALDALIGRQYWRAARHDVGDDEINYRRFFTVSDLAAVRIEEPELFEHTHALIFSLIAEGLVEGLRIDHIDGLYDPSAYCRKLREASPRPVYVIVEKILGEGETLPARWDVEGTTGYEFAALVNPLLVDPHAEAAMTQFYRQLTGVILTPAAMEEIGKLRVMDHELAAELDALTTRLMRLASTPPGRDLARAALKRGLRAITADLPVYRLYRDANGISAADREVALATIARSRRRCPEINAAIFDLLEAVLIGFTGESPEALDTALRLQQFTGPVMAKGLEDTALYRYNRLIALNDVGERPDRFTRTIAEFHDANRERAASYPHSMLGTSSHDSKRGEDTRARLVALSGRPDQWAAKVHEWLGLLAQAGAPPINPDDAYQIFQLVVGAWPVGLTPEAAGDLSAFADRLVGAMMKSLREARLRSLWGHPNEDYEARIEAVIRRCLDPAAGPLFASIAGFSADIGLDGAINGLIETTLKLTVPGVPDIYQGAEFWEQSMVDPDNRRPVDFARRQAELAEPDPHAPLEQLLEHWQDGAVKQQLIARLLGFRRRHRELFDSASYEPLELGDPARICAFRRRSESDELLVAVRLYPWRDRKAGSQPLEIDLPSTSGRWVNLLSGDELTETLSARASARLPILVLSTASD